MKKIIYGILIGLIIIINGQSAFGYKECVTNSQCGNGMICNGGACILDLSGEGSSEDITAPQTNGKGKSNSKGNSKNEGTNTQQEEDSQQTETTPQNECTSDSECTAKGQGMCITGDNNTRICIYNEYGDLGFNITTECLLNGQCGMNIYETAGIRKKDTTPSVKTFAQDVVLAATTFFGTVISIIFIVSGLMYVFSGFTGKSPDKAKKMMIGSIVGLLFVTLSYSIIRLIQFLATGGGGS